MLSHFKHLFKSIGRTIKKCELQNSFQNEKLTIALGCDFYLNDQARNFHATPRMGVSRETQYAKAAREEAKKEDRVTEIYRGQLSRKREEGYFPTVDLPNTLFGEIAYKNLPIVLIKATSNNTILTLKENGLVKLTRSCGSEGFKNARKGTNVAAQAVGVSFGGRLLKRGCNIIRVCIKGLGPGRLSSIKGLQLSGVQVVSVSDHTPDQTSLRPRKQRRL